MFSSFAAICKHQHRKTDGYRDVQIHFFIFYTGLGIDIPSTDHLKEQSGTGGNKMSLSEGGIAGRNN